MIESHSSSLYEIDVVTGVVSWKIAIEIRSIDLCLVAGSSSPPILFNVSPQFGPVAGGTRVTISGPRLSYADATVALFPVDQTRYDIIPLTSESNNRFVVNDRNIRNLRTTSKIVCYCLLNIVTFEDTI